MAKKRLYKLNDERLSFYLIDPSRPLSGMWYVKSYDFREKDMTLKMVRISEREAITVTNIGSKQDARLSKNDVLIYIKPQEARGFSDSLTTQLSYEQLERVEVYETNYGKSVSMSFVGYVTVGLVMAALITGGFCPSVYAVNPADCPLQGELFAASAWPNAVRTEYLYMPDIKPRDDIYTIRLNGKNGQVQHLDEIGLYAIEHPIGTQVVVDQKGKPQIISAPKMPIGAVDHHGYDASALVSASDAHFWPTFQASVQNEETQSLELIFPKPSDATTARLHIKAKNSLWLDAVFNDYRQRFPEALPGLHSSRAETDAWLQHQQMNLNVSLMDDHEKWKNIGKFNPNGTFMMRDEVMEIDLSQHKGNEIRIKLACGFQFWELDYAAMDFSFPMPVTKEGLVPASVSNPALDSADGQTLTLSHFNEDVSLSFRAPKPCREGMQHSLFVKGTGFYTFTPLTPTGKPQKAMSLPEYSRRKWQAHCKIKT